MSSKVLSALFLTLIFVLVETCVAAAQEATPSPSPVPAVADQSQQTSAATPAATPLPEGALYSAPDDIYTIDREATFYYYYQNNKDDSGKAKRELRYKRNLWVKNAQIGIRIPFVTSHPVNGDNKTGLSNIELGYNYNVTSPTFNHSLEFRVALPTVANGVTSNDTQLKGFWTTKWKFNNKTALAYTNEYDQTIIHPPGSSWTSYYEGKLTYPDWGFRHALVGVNITAFYNFRILFDSSGQYKDALGLSLFGTTGNTAISITDSWGIGGNGLWKYKGELNISSRF